MSAADSAVMRHRDDGNGSHGHTNDMLAYWTSRAGDLVLHDVLKLKNRRTGEEYWGIKGPSKECEGYRPTRTR